MKHSNALIGLLLASGSAVLACSSEPASSESGASAATVDPPAHHTAGEPLQSSSPFQWLEITDHDLAGLAGSDIASEYVPVFAPADGVLTKRLQFWADAIDARVRAASPISSAAAPKPRPRVLASDRLNAWVASLPRCIHAKTSITFGEAGADAERFPITVLEPNRVGPLTSGPRGDFPVGTVTAGTCYETPLSSSAAEYARWLEESGAPCKVSFASGTLRVTGGEGCTRAGGAAASKEAAQFAASSVIAFTSKLVAGFSEAEMVAVLAHELGHYYRSHATSGWKYDYFYVQEENPRPGRPVPVEDSARLLAVREAIAKEKASAAQKEAFYAELKARNLGLWTTEQEADDFANEQLAAIGIDPRSAISGQFAFGRAREARNPAAATDPDDLSMSACEALYRNHWADPATGKYTFVPLGGVDEPHHGTCYRIFNMDREIKAHGYVVAPPLKVAFKEPWATAQAEAAALVPLPQPM
jgi:hypothetical protein